jgi:hypothetical protein
MNTRQLFLPRPFRILFKKGRRIGARIRASLLTLKLNAGFPYWIAAYLSEQALSGSVVLSKQGVLGILTSKQYLRFAQSPKARKRLKQEIEGWRSMRAAGHGDMVVRFMEAHELPEGLVISAEPLSPVSAEQHLQVIFPIVRRLAAAATPRTPEKLPESIIAGLAFAKDVGADLVRNFVAEEELQAAFSQPLLTGHFHKDLHWCNVLHRNGEPVLIDLKKCQPDRLLCLDIINIACMSLTATTGANVVSLAYDAHRRGWSDLELAPLLSLVDLPRTLWGPAYVLHTAGLYRLKRSAWGEEVLFRRILQQDWCRFSTNPRTSD